MSKLFKPKKIFTIIAVCFGIFLFFLTSETIYTYKNHPEDFETLRYKYNSQNIKKSYLIYESNSDNSNKLNKIIFHKITPRVYYSYLTGNNNKYSSLTCRPICVTREESNLILNLLRKFNLNDDFNYLSAVNKSKLYFWIATINIQNTDNIDETISLLKSSKELNQNNSDTNLFLSDLEKLKYLKANEEFQAYFKDKIESTNEMENYKKFYYSQASFILGNNALYYKDYPDSVKYFERAIDFNKWNADNYVNLSYSYLSLGKSDLAIQTLNKCEEYLKEDAKNCTDYRKILERK